MELSEKQYLEIAEHLKNIQTMYQNVLEIETFEQEKIILQYFISLSDKLDELKPLKDVCKEVLHRFKDGVNYYETTLIDEAMKRLEPEYKRLLPTSWFEKDMLFYQLSYTAIEEQFHVFNSYNLERRFELIIEQLNRLLFNTFINNPNFKGENPYYKHHYDEFERSKTLTKKLLDNNFSNYIEFFKGN